MYVREMVSWDGLGRRWPKMGSWDGLGQRWPKYGFLGRLAENGLLGTFWVFLIFQAPFSSRFIVFLAFQVPFSSRFTMFLALQFPFSLRFTMFLALQVPFSSNGLPVCQHACRSARSPEGLRPDADERQRSQSVVNAPSSGRIHYATPLRNRNPLPLYQSLPISEFKIPERMRMRSSGDMV